MPVPEGIDQQDVRYRLQQYEQRFGDIDKHRLAVRLKGSVISADVSDAPGYATVLMTEYLRRSEWEIQKARLEAAHADVVDARIIYDIYRHGNMLYTLIHDGTQPADDELAEDWSDVSYDGTSQTEDPFERLERYMRRFGNLSDHECVDRFTGSVRWTTHPSIPGIAVVAMKSEKGEEVQRKISHDRLKAANALFLGAEVSYEIWRHGALMYSIVTYIGQDPDELLRSGWRFIGDDVIALLPEGPEDSAQPDSADIVGPDGGNVTDGPPDGAVYDF